MIIHLACLRDLPQEKHGPAFLPFPTLPLIESGGVLDGVSRSAMLSKKLLSVAEACKVSAELLQSWLHQPLINLSMCRILVAGFSGSSLSWHMLQQEKLSQSLWMSIWLRWKTRQQRSFLTDPFCDDGKVTVGWKCFGFVTSQKRIAGILSVACN